MNKVNYFYNVPTKTEIDSLSLHDALPILGELDSYQGNMDAAIEQYEEAYRIASEKVPQAIPLMDFTLGVAYLQDRKSTRLNSSHMSISYAVFCLKKKTTDY